MSTQIQYRRGTAAQNDVFTGAQGEITVDTTNVTLRVHDGVTIGGTTLETKARSLVINNHANGAFSKANSANIVAQGAYDLANSTTTYAGSAYGHANGAFSKANSANVLAQGAYDRANTKFNSAGGTISGDVIITSNLTVQGTKTIINTATLNVADPLIILASNNSSDAESFGFSGVPCTIKIVTLNFCLSLSRISTVSTFTKVPFSKISFASGSASAFTSLRNY
jgi:hypothetical protein